MSLLKRSDAVELRASLRIYLEERTSNIDTSKLVCAEPIEALSWSESVSSNSFFRELFNYIPLIHIVLVQFPENSTWIEAKNSNVYNFLISIWSSQGRLDQILNEETVRLNIIDETKQLSECLIQTAKSRPDDFSLLLKLLEVFLQRSYIDTSFVADFFLTDFPLILSFENKIELVQFVCSKLVEANFSHLRCKLVQYLIFPNLSIFKSSATKHVNALLNKLVDIFMLDDFILGVNNDDLVINILKSVSELLIGGVVLPSSYRQNLYNCILAITEYTADHVSVKSVAYVTLANFCRFVDMEKMDQNVFKEAVYRKLLQSTPEMRYYYLLFFVVFRFPTSIDLVQINIALDIIIPVVVQFPSLGALTFSIMTKDCTSAISLAHVVHFVIRNGDIFYLYRMSLLQTLIPSMGRFGTTAGRPMDMRKLSLDTAELLILWDTRAAKENSELLPANMIEQICVFLINMCFSTCLGANSSEEGTLCRRSHKLFKDALNFWKAGYVKFQWLQVLILSFLNFI